MQLIVNVSGEYKTEDRLALITLAISIINVVQKLLYVAVISSCLLPLYVLVAITYYTCIIGTVACAISAASVCLLNYNLF